MNNQHLLDSLRSVTDIFIKSAGMEVELIPQPTVSETGAGRVRQPQPPRASQWFQIIEPPDSGLLSNFAAEDRYLTYVLLGNYDAIAAVGDTFTYDGTIWEITSLLHNNGYEFRAALTRHDTR